MDVMLDIETLATTNDATISSIGAVRFTMSKVYENQTIYGEIDREDCARYGRVEDERCIEDFWEPLGGVLQGEVPLKAALETLNTFLEGVQCVWTCGPHFDIAILQDSYQAVGLEPNWKFWLVRDYRTVANTVGQHVARKEHASHNALEDAVQQAQHLIDINNYLQAIDEDLCVIR
tara:strand:+ start:61 stop:588 length:528 start_codon:yes stop_codon:yes gene_type:complete